MDGKRFDSLARTVGRRRSRRDAFQALAAAGLAAAAARLGLGAEPAAEAQVTVERRFNCTAVGDTCKGNDSQCCSGRCKGKKRKEGKNGNGIGETRASASLMIRPGARPGRIRATLDIAVACGFRGRGGCLKTTGNASFCGQIEGQRPPRLHCENCTTDQDCEALGYGSGAACVVCDSNASSGITTRLHARDPRTSIGLGGLPASRADLKPAVAITVPSPDLARALHSLQ